ncbi:MAG TPA: YqcI/YcgG family protein, partial [Chryseosolibacter sp.]
AQFEEMRKTDKYQKLQRIIRKRDILYSGSINPMLSDFGEASEAFQYSGKVYQQDWTCPLKVTHANTNGNSAKK